MALSSSTIYHWAKIVSHFWNRVSFGWSIHGLGERGGEGEEIVFLSNHRSMAWFKKKALFIKSMEKENVSLGHFFWILKRKNKTSLDPGLWMVRPRVLHFTDNVANPPWSEPGWGSTNPNFGNSLRVTGTHLRLPSNFFHCSFWHFRNPICLQNRILKWSSRRRIPHNLTTFVLYLPNFDSNVQGKSWALCIYKV